MTHWLWLQPAKGKGVAHDSPVTEACIWALATRFLYLEFKKMFYGHKNQWVCWGSFCLHPSWQEPLLASMQP